MRRYDIVIFDLDGTLLDTIEDLGTAVNHALSLRGFPLHTMSEYRGMVGHGIRNLVQQALGSDYESFTDDCLKDFVSYYTAHIDDRTRPYPGIVELVTELHGAGVHMAVASNKFQAGAERLVAEFFPGIPFVAVLGNAPGLPLKPDPEIVSIVLNRVPASDGPVCGTDFSTAASLRAVLVGDSATDIETARRSGIPSIAVSWGFRPRVDIAAAGTIADSVDELRSLLLSK